MRPKASAITAPESPLSEKTPELRSAIDDGPFFRHRALSFEIATSVGTDIVTTAYSDPGFGTVLNHQAWVVVGVDHG